MQHLPAGLCILAAVQATMAAGSGHATKSPVEKVVQLLTDLKAKVEMDGKSEEMSYNKYACWCEKTTARKADSISNAQTELRSIGQQMLMLKGTIATLVSETEELVEAIKANEEAQAEATSIRTKESKAYGEETDEMKLALKALQQAIQVLRSGTLSSSFLQQGSQATLALRSVVAALPTAPHLKPDQVALLTELASGSQDAKYAPQSLTVQGMLIDMYKQFAADLESATHEEAARWREYETLRETKEQQLIAKKAEKQKKEHSKAEAESSLADVTQSYDDTADQKDADIVFFDETKAACASKHEEWAKRGELRSDELDAISKALELLTSDEARKLFGSSIKPGKETNVDESYDAGVSAASFVQLSELGSERAPALRAFAALKASASKAHSLRLAALAVQVHEATAGHFDKVIGAIDAMIATLKEEEAADIEKRDQCLEEYQKVNSTVADLGWLIEKNEAALDKIGRLIADLEDEMAKTIQAIDDIGVQMKAMTAERKSGNELFQGEKKDDQQAIGLLVQARAFLADFYAKNSIELGPIQGDVKGLELSQQGPEFAVSADQAPEATVSEAGSRRLEAKGVVQFLTMIIEDLSDEIKNAMKAEELAQIEYEKQMASAKALKESLVSKKVNLESMISKRKEEQDLEAADMATNQRDLASEHDYKKKITPDCDWIIGAFKERVLKRAAEMNGLVAAKEFLAGYKPTASALLDQKHIRPFDDNAFSKIDFLSVQ